MNALEEYLLEAPLKRHSKYSAKSWRLLAKQRQETISKLQRTRE